MIDLKEYEELKEYYDFQRKKEYNREQLQDAILEVEKRTGISALSFILVFIKLYRFL